MQTLRALIYASTPILVFSWIGMFGIAPLIMVMYPHPELSDPTVLTELAIIIIFIVVPFLWTLVLTAIGIQEFHHCERNTAVKAVILAVMTPIVIIGILIVAMMF